MLDTDTVDTMAFIGRSVLISLACEDMSEMSSTVSTDDFSTSHTKCVVHMADDGSRNLFEEGCRATINKRVGRYLEHTILTWPSAT
jgi:hypothetical protein